MEPSNVINSIKKFFVTNLRFVVDVVIVLIAIGAVWYIFSNKAPTLGFYTVTRGNVISSDDIPGTVSASSSVDLSFQEAGQIEKVDVQEGQSVNAGDALVSLDDSTQQAQLSQEQAVLASAQAELAKLEEGTRPEQLAVYQQQYDNASAALTVAMNNAYLESQDAIVNKVDALFTNGDTVNPTLNIPDTYEGTSDQYAVNNERVAIGTALTDWKNTLSEAATATSSLDDARTATSNNIALAESFLNHLSVIVGNLSTGNSGLSQGEINTDTSLVNAASQEVTAAANTETTADSAWSSAQDSLTLAQAGSQSQDIEAQNDVVAEAQAAIDNAQIAIDHATIVAPFSGIVRNVTAKKGMVVSANMPVLSIINNGIMKFDAYASETDVPNIQNNATTTVTLDAYGDGVQFPAQTTAVDTSQTIINNSPAYHVTLYFTEPDDKILAGMTGDVHVITGEHNNVIEVPSHLVLDNNGNDFVLVQNNGKVTQQPVTLGIRGDDGVVEIVSGLNAGQNVVDF